MDGNQIMINKNDVRVMTSGKNVDIAVYVRSGDTLKRATIVTMKRDTAVHLHEALGAYLQLDRTM